MTTRFAVVSDIHGNLPALEAVIAHIAARGVTDIVNLGDCVSGPLWAAETGERLIALGWPTVSGNHERQLLTLDIADMGKTDAAAADKITPEIRDWMAAMPSQIRYAQDVLLCHGTPDHDDRYWLHRGQRGAIREATIVEIETDAVDVALTLCGHTHLPRSAMLSDGRIVANPGSVGLPAYEDDLPTYHIGGEGTPQARYLIAENDGLGWNVHLQAVDYDFELAARKAEHAGSAKWAHALRTGKIRKKKKSKK